MRPEKTNQRTMRCAVVPLSPCQVFRQIGPEESLVRVALPRKGVKALAETLSNLLKADVRSDYFGLDLHVEERELDGELFKSMQVVEDIAREEVARKLHATHEGCTGCANEHFAELSSVDRESYFAKATEEIQRRIRERKTAEEFETRSEAT